MAVAGLERLEETAAFAGERRALVRHLREIRAEVECARRALPDDVAEADITAIFHRNGEVTTCLGPDPGAIAVYRAALEDAIDYDVDLVDIHTLSPAFAHVVSTRGTRIVGSADRWQTLKSRIAGEEPTVETARKRVTAAAKRLRNGPT